MDDRTLMLLVSAVVLSGTLVAFLVQYVRSRRRDDDDSAHRDDG
ncbi:hypothetical protein [Microbacterium caowuchunii]|nr:hypothetical protein [Microbacterium caowuchunii]